MGKTDLIESTAVASATLESIDTTGDVFTSPLSIIDNKIPYEVKSDITEATTATLYIKVSSTQYHDFFITVTVNINPDITPSVLYNETKKFSTSRAPGYSGTLDINDITKKDSNAQILDVISTNPDIKITSIENGVINYEINKDAIAGSAGTLIIKTQTDDSIFELEYVINFYPEPDSSVHRETCTMSMDDYINMLYDEIEVEDTTTDDMFCGQLSASKVNDMYDGKVIDLTETGCEFCNSVECSKVNQAYDNA